MKFWKKGVVLAVTLLLTAGMLQIAQPAVSGATADTGTISQKMASRLGGALVCYTGSPLAVVNNNDIQVDSGNGEVTPVVKAQRVLVPARFIAENLQAAVSWDELSKTATIHTGNKVIKLVTGSSTAQINEEIVTLDAPAEIINGRVFVPLRMIGGALGKEVFYDRGLIILSNQEELFNKDTEKDLLDQLIARVNNLPVVGSYENLLKLVPEESRLMRQSLALADAGMAKAASEAGQQNKAKEESAGPVYSSTNIQVQGVDEADLVKTDGRYIYQASQGQIVVSRAYPAEEMKVVSRIRFSDENFTPQELFLDGAALVVLGDTDTIQPYLTKSMVNLDIYPPARTVSRTKALQYDIQDPANITKVREIELDGRYVTSRKIGASLYVIANHYLDYYWLQQKGENITPSYRDTAVQEDPMTIPYDKIRYIPPVRESGYLVIAGLDLAKPAEAAQISTYLGVGEEVYVSNNNMYIALTRQNLSLLPAQENTAVYKFSLQQGKVTYLCKGEVPGRILNQFSMDENKHTFRIATTVNQPWSSVKPSPWNNVYILDESMNITGKLEGIAPGEQIYSTRFMGERAYMVTFKSVDPLFVIDLQDAANPRILGALKIPGYSDYLHPYDENHIIGFGKDTVELPQKDHKGKAVGTTAYYLGVKMALFDVSDVSNPKEKYNVKIGDRGTDSELLYDHKALLFSKEKGLLAFPVTVREVSGNAVDERTGIPQYGQFTFQGAYVYNLDLANGFVLKGRITHLSESDLLKAGIYNADSALSVKRVIYIDDVLYTLSDRMIKANGLQDLQEKKALTVGE